MDSTKKPNETGNTAFQFKAPITRSRSRSGPHLTAPQPQSKNSNHNHIQSAITLNPLNMVHQITAISNDIKYKRELNKTKELLKQIEVDYEKSMEIIASLHEEMEDEKLYYITRENILIEKNEILTTRLSEYKEKYQQIEIRNKYIDPINVDEEIIIPVLENNISNEEIDALKQSLKIAKDNLLRKDTKIKALSDNIISLQKENNELRQNGEELDCLISKEIDESQKEIESQIAELTDRCLVLEKEKKDLQELLEKREDGVTLLHALNEQLKIHQKQYTQQFSSLSAFTLDGLHRQGSMKTDSRSPSNANTPNTGSMHMNEMYSVCMHKINQTLMCMMDDYPFSGDDEMATIVEECMEDDFKEPEPLSMSNKAFSTSKESKSMRWTSDNEEDILDELLSNKEFMNTDAVRRLSNSNKMSMDVMKQYLHLTASAVKIKYPNIRIKTDDLTRRVKQCSFYQYHDQMVRIMEMEKRKMTTSKKLVNRRKSERINKSIANLNDMKSVSKITKQWKEMEKENNLPMINENKSMLKKKRKKRSKKKKIKKKVMDNTKRGIENVDHDDNHDNDNVDNQNLNTWNIYNSNAYNDSNIYSTVVFKNRDDLKKALNEYQD